MASSIYHDAKPTPTLPMEETNRGLQMMLGMGYNRNQSLGRNSDGHLEPIIAERRMQKLGLDCTPLSITMHGRGAPSRVVRSSPQISTTTFRAPVCLGVPVDNVTFDVTDVCASSDDDDTIVGLPRLFEDSILLMISASPAESNQQTR